MDNGQISALFSRPFHGLRFRFAPLPAINRWAIIGRPLTGLGLEYFCARPTRTVGSRQERLILSLRSKLSTSSFLASFSKSEHGRAGHGPAGTP